MIAALLWLASAQIQENRQWQVDLELRGECAAVRLDCGPAGETLLRGPFAPGEDRRFQVPVPVRSPLGAAGLSGVPLPLVELIDAMDGSEAHVLGWSVSQPAEALREPMTPGSRLEPPARTALARPGRAELLVVLVAGGFLLHFRRRMLPALLIAGAGSLVAFSLARARAPDPEAGVLLQWDFGQPMGLRTVRGEGELPILGTALEVRPEGLAVRVEWDARGHGRAWATGGSLLALQPASVPPLQPTGNAGPPLEEVWTRNAGGPWRTHGGWGTGQPLGPAREGLPPGWLAGPVPSDRGLLVARQGATWLRCLGFPAE